MSSEQDNTQLVQRAYVAFGQGDIPSVLALVADDVEWSEPGSADVLPWGGQRRGRQQVGEFFQAVEQAVTFEAFEPQEFIAQGETVVVLGHDRTVVKSSGQRVENDWAMVFTIRDAKIVRFRDYYDTAPYVAALRSS